MTSKDLTYQDIVKLRKELEKNKGGFYEHPIVITYGQAMQIESECLALEQQNEKLEKAFKLACKRLDWDCPCGQDLIDDLDCENRCQPDIDYSECWVKYFLKEVLGNEMV